MSNQPLFLLQTYLFRSEAACAPKSKVGWFPTGRLFLTHPKYTVIPSSNPESYTVQYTVRLMYAISEKQTRLRLNSKNGDIQWLMMSKNFR